MSQLPDNSTPTSLFVINNIQLQQVVDLLQELPAKNVHNLLNMLLSLPKVAGGVNEKKQEQKTENQKA
jgi:hypothetical protein